MKKKKILIIDDDADFCSIQGEILETEGYQVLQGVGGAKGLRVATEKHPDLILLDIDMPDINGYEVLNELKKRNIPTRIVMITGKDWSIADIVKYIKAGACDFCLKESDLKPRLLHIIERNLEIEATLNLQVSNPAPIVSETMARAENLAHENRELWKTVKELEDKLNYKPRLITSGIDLSFLIASAGITLLICYFASIKETWIIVSLPIIIFFLLKLPFEKISKVSVKVPTSEANLELQSELESGQNQLPK